MLTLKNVVELEILKGAIVRTAKQRLDEQPVEWVSIMDIPVENYIRKNELVLNIGAGAGKDMNTFLTFVESVYESGASALAIAKGKYIVDIPQSVLAFAEEKEFPIIEVPWEIRSAEVIHSVMNEIKKDQNEEMEIVENIQQHLLNIILQSPTLSKVSNYISEKLGFPLIIIDKTGMIKGKSVYAQEFAEKWTLYKKNNDIPQTASLTYKHHPLHARIERIKWFDHMILQIPIESSNRINGYIMVDLKNEEEIDVFLNNKNVSILEQSSTVLALWFLRENAIEETKNKLRGDFVWRLAKGEFMNDNQKIAQAKSLGYKLDISYTCVIGSVENYETLYQRNQTHTSFERWKGSMEHMIQEEIFIVTNMSNKRAMITNHDDEIILFLEASMENYKEQAHNFLELLSRRLNNLLPGLIISWGIGRCHDNNARFVASYNEAQLALEIGRKKDGKTCRTNYDDTRVERALVKMAKDEEIRDIVNQTIKPLLSYDLQKNTNFIDTITTYNENQGKISQTARDLHLHRHSLIYRLKKIEGIVNLSIIDPEDRFLLELCIKLWKLGEVEVKT
ncbi:purine catabolism regulatory protein [Halobacillus karajensis]|uniref:Purine catabolism regulatory protein n=1 Tax=Halobacillus karajensis TaxID=195088 RepID=A0A024P2F7_9BACI|nr:PucR family transcriptional regulator [Halobacillus karajensis]CDQ19641.1 Purine catabolism regulatory protein [Halobacillus karajensis]CDQ22101.1 Purine catabolism regulatory protein [Halobacillus karajensis]CDQ27942.1 Purine catabolism regulatory protein [Halobacillus karajensis]SEH79030.1 purine catabolism regulatory protein [Halobacillus karajensis]